MMGEASHSLDIMPEHFHRWENDCNIVAAVEEAAAKLKGHLATPSRATTG